MDDVGGFVGNGCVLLFSCTPKRNGDAAEVGTTLGKILKDGENLDLTRASSYEEAYATFSIGECAWYAYGRFKEVHDIWLPLTQGMGGIKEWLQNVRLSDGIKAEYSINDVPEQSIAVYIPTEEFRDWPRMICKTFHEAGLTILAGMSATHVRIYGIVARWKI